MILSSGVAHAQSLKGSPASVDRMYTRAVLYELQFLKTSKTLYEAVKDHELVMLSVTMDMTMDDVTYPFVLPRTRDFVNTFASKYHQACGERLVVTSAARPRTEQPRNASPKSVHPTGMAVDFRKPAGECLTWMRNELVLLEKQGILEATEEKHPVHFHVAVFQRGAFVPPAGVVATASPAATAVVASATAVATDSASGIVAVDDMDLLTLGTSNPAAQPIGDAEGWSGSAGADEDMGTNATTAAKSATKSTPAKTQASNASYYTVRKGDTISEIAKKFGLSSARLLSLNGLKKSTIQPGQKLRVK
jgi:LysM repeat protein